MKRRKRSKRGKKGEGARENIVHSTIEFENSGTLLLVIDIQCRESHHQQPSEVGCHRFRREGKEGDGGDDGEDARDLMGGGLVREAKVNSIDKLLKNESRIHFYDEEKGDATEEEQEEEEGEDERRMSRTTYLPSNRSWRCLSQIYCRLD